MNFFHILKTCIQKRIPPDTTYSVEGPEKKWRGVSAAKVLTVREAKEFLPTAPIVLARKAKKEKNVVVMKVPTGIRV